MLIRAATEDDADALWAIIAPILRAGETYALPRDWTREEGLAFWLGANHRVFVAVEAGSVVGTYYLHPNQRGGGSHVANCGYMTSPAATGRGVARAMCADSLERAAASGFRAMQFNLVVSTNTRAVALWQAFGFSIVGTLAEAFRHPEHGLVDAHVMYRLI